MLPESIPVTTDLNFCSPDTVFFCPEESQFYAQCLERMVFSQCSSEEIISEFGAGDGSPVIFSLLRSPFNSTIRGYELNPAACELARSRVLHYRLGDRYKIQNQCFFEGFNPNLSNYLIANPPYLPAPDNDICLPALHGGTDGAAITKRLFTVGCEHVCLMISAYSNPVETIEYAIDQGYQVTDFMVAPLPFGYYSSEPKVRQTIDRLQKSGQAFYSGNTYLLAGVLFQMRSPFKIDLSNELIKVMTAL
jgi:hypothetical protein